MRFVLSATFFAHDSQISSHFGKKLTRTPPGLSQYCTGENSVKIRCRLGVGEHMYTYTEKSPESTPNGPLQAMKKGCVRLILADKKHVYGAPAVNVCALCT